MSATLNLEITLDSKGAVAGVKSLDTTIGGLDKTTQQTTKSGKGLFDSIFAQVTAANLATKAIGALTGFVKGSVGAFMESEAIQADMEATMRTLGIATEANISRFNAFADTILKTTTIDDEAARSMIALGLTMGVTSDRIEEAVKGAIGLGKAFGLDAQTAMKGVSAAMQGNFTLLGRYIPALKSATTEQEKWALVQKAMLGGFQREEESISKSLGWWKQLQNQIGETKETVGKFLVGAIKWLFDAREAIAAAALAMGTLFTIGKINTWVASLKAGEGALMLIVQRAQMLHAMGEGGIISFGKSINYASGEVVGLSGLLSKLPFIGAAAFVGWKIGERIGEITGLNTAVQNHWEFLIQTSFLRSKSTAELSAHSAATAKVTETIRAMSKVLGDTNGSLMQNALTVFQNKEAFGKLSPEIQATVIKLATARQAFLDTPPAVQGVTNSLGTMGTTFMMINPALLGFGKALDIIFQNGRGMETFIEANTKAMQRQKQAADEAQAIVEKYGLKTKGFNEAGREMYVQLMQIGGYLPTLVDNTKEVAEATEKYGLDIDGLNEAGREAFIQLMQLGGLVPTLMTSEDQANVEKYGLNIEGLTEAGRELNLQLYEVFRLMMQMRGVILPDLKLPKAAEETKKWTLNWEDANEVMEFAKSLMGEIGNALSALGIDLGETGQSLMQAAEGAATFVQGMLSGNPLTIIAGGIKIITAAIKLFAGDGVGEAIKRENQWMQLTKDQIKQLRELEKQYGSTHAATSEMLDSIIGGADITADNFDKWAKRLRGILSDYDQGTMTLGQTTKQMGDAFTALIGKAKELGTEGSASLLNMFEDLSNRGVRVAEVEAYIAEQLGAGLAGYEKMKAAILESAAAQEAFGNINIQVYEEMIAYNAKIAANKGLTDAIAGATAALIGLSNTTKLTEGQYDQFEQSAAAAYDQLIATGFTEKESLQQLAPMLARLKFLHDEYGLTLDAETQRLLDAAEANGINTDQAMSQAEANDRIVKSLERLVEVLGGASKAAGDLSDSMDKAVRDRTANITFSKNGEIPNEWNYDKKPDVYAASGFYSPRLSSDTLIQAHRGEQVAITPAAQNNGSGRTTYLNITITGPGVTPEAVADAAAKAYKDNTHGFRSLMES